MDTAETEMRPALCVPAGEDCEDYLECLLLRPFARMGDVKRGNFQRIGMGKVRKHKDEPYCLVEHGEWDSVKSMHRIFLV
jgi:hypothetical protein